MGKECKINYYDKDGNPSATYYETLEKEGEEVAKAAYASEMAVDGEALNSKINKLDTSEILKKLKSSNEISREKIKSKGTYTSFSSLMSKDKTADDIIYSYIAINLKTTDEIKKDEHKGKTWEQVRNYVANEYFKYNRVENKLGTSDPKIQEEFNRYKIDAEKLNNFQQNSGNGIHLFLEYLFKAKENGGYDGIEHFDKYYNEAVREYKINYNPDEHEELSDTMFESLRPEVKTFVRNILVLERKLDTKFKIFTEQHLISDKVKLDGKGAHGYVDLMLYDPKNNIAYLYDFKTKSEQSYKNSDNPFNPYLPAPFDLIVNNASNRARLQLSLYKKILEIEYGITVAGLNVFTIVSSIKEEGEVGDKTYNLYNINANSTNIKSVDPYEIGDVDEESLRTPKRRSPDDIVEELFDGKLVTTAQSSANFIKNQTVHIKEENGKFTWWDIFKHKYITKNSKEDMISYIKSSYKNYITVKKKAASHLVDLFETGAKHRDTIWARSSYGEKADQILQPFTNGDWELKTARDLPELKDIGSDIIIAHNKINGETVLISLAAAYDSTYYFHEAEDDTRTTILGHLMSDKAVDKKFDLSNIPQATTHSLALFRLGLIADSLRRSDSIKYNKITKLESVTLEGTERNYSYSTVEQQLGLLNVMIEAMEYMGVEVPAELRLAIENKTKVNDQTVSDNIFKQLMMDIRGGVDPLTKLQEKFGKSLNKRKISSVIEAMRKFSAEIDRAEWDMSFYEDLKKTFDRYYMIAFDSVMAIKRTTDKDVVYNDQLFKAVNEAYLSFNDLYVLENPRFKKSVLRNLNSLTTLGEPLAEKLHISIERFMQQSRDELVGPIDEHLKLQKKLMDETPGVNRLTSMFTPDNSAKIFKTMVEDEFRFDDGNTNNWMKFKDPEKRLNDKSYLTDTQREYIRFYVKHAQDALVRLFPSKVVKELMGGIKGEKGKWDPLYIPIIPQSAGEELRQTMSLRKNQEITAKDVFTSFTKALKSLRKKPLSGTQEHSKPYTFMSFFTNQVDTLPGRGSRETRNLLKITEDGEKISDDRKIEMNPATILNLLMVEVTRKEHMQAASLAAMAVDAKLAYEKAYPGVDIKELREIIRLTTNMRIHNRVEKEEGTLAAITDVLRKSTSFALFTGSIRQISTEFNTGSLQNLSQMIANGINSFLFKGDTIYDTKDRAWAAKEIVSDFGMQVMNSLGMYNTSIGEFTSTDYNAFKDKFIFQTKNGHAAVKTILKQNFEGVVLAQMHKKGLTKNIYSYDKSTKLYTYDETKDPRFYVYSEELDIEGQQTKPPEKNTEDYNKWLYWKAYRREMIKEGGIDSKTNKIKRPFIMDEMQAMKQQAIQMLGPMDSTEMMAAEGYALGRAGMIFKKWLFRKKTNYNIQKGKSFKMVEMMPVLDEYGKIIDYAKKWNDFEDYFESLRTFIKAVRRHGSFKAGVNSLTNHQKQNISKLLGDLLLRLLIASALLGAGILTKDAVEKIKKNKDQIKATSLNAIHTVFENANELLMKELQKGFYNAVGDLIPLMAFDQAISGSTFAAFSITSQSVKSLSATLWYSVTGDLDNAIHAADKTMDVFGGWRTTKGAAALFLRN